MIVFRYLSREVLLTFSAVSAVLLVIIMSGRFIKYLAQAAQGVLDPGVLLMIMGYRIPGFLQLILPLGLFLGILLAYGRLYLESEMTVLTATGMSEQRLLSYTLVPAFFVALITAWLSFYMAPQGVQSVARIFSEQDALTEFDTLVPGRFQSLRGGSRVTYTQELSSGRDVLHNVFISEKRPTRAGSDVDEAITVLVAKTGRQEIQADGSRYLILQDGYRYDGTPGEADYRVIQYETYGVLLPKPSVEVKMGERETIATRELLGNPDVRMQSELQWRLSFPILVLIVTLIAVPLSRVNPRQGRFLKLLPAILLYMSYLALLVAARSALDKGKLPIELGLWPVHAIFLIIGLVLVYWQPLQLRRARLRANKETQHA